MTKTEKTAKKNLVTGGRSGWRCLLVVMASLSVSAGVRAAPITLNFNYTVVQGTCTVNVQNSNGVISSVIPLPDIAMPTPLTNWKGYGVTNFSVQLSGCSGVSETGKAPSLTLTGNHGNIAGNADDKSFLFRDNVTGEDAAGFGFVIYNRANGVQSNGWEMADVNGPTTNTSAKYLNLVGVTGSALNGDKNVPLSAAVTCGSSCTDTSVTKLAGKLSATITFNFLYH